MKQIKEMTTKTYSNNEIETEKVHFDIQGREYLRIKNNKTVSNLQFIDLGTVVDHAKEVTIIINPSGKPIFVRDKNENVLASYEYDDNGNCIKYIDNNVSMQFMYDTDNNLVCKKMSTGYEEYHLYLNSKKVFTIKKFDGIITYNIEYKYDDKGNCITEINNGFLYDDNNDNIIIETCCKCMNYNDNNDVTQVFMDNILFQEFEYEYYENEPVEPNNQY